MDEITREEIKDKMAKSVALSRYDTPQQQKINLTKYMAEKHAKIHQVLGQYSTLLYSVMT
jgi:hypothetical protein